MITVFYRNTLTNGEFDPISILVQNGIENIPTPSDPNNPNNRYGYTRFRIHFLPKTGVGTYSYIIKSSNAANTGIQDRIRNSFTTSPLLASGNFMDQNANGLGNETTGEVFWETPTRLRPQPRPSTALDRRRLCSWPLRSGHAPACPRRPSRD